MPRERVPLPRHVDFSTGLRVRVNDVNYGRHLANDAVLTLTHEVRLQWLETHQWQENDLDGIGIIQVDAAVVYKSQAALGQQLAVDMSVTDCTSRGFAVTTIFRHAEGRREVARVRTGFVFFDYAINKLARTPPAFAALFGERAQPVVV